MKSKTIHAIATLLASLAIGVMAWPADSPASPASGGSKAPSLGLDGSCRVGARGIFVFSVRNVQRIGVRYGGRLHATYRRPKNVHIGSNGGEHRMFKVRQVSRYLSRGWLKAVFIARGSDGGAWRWSRWIPVPRSDHCLALS